MLRIISPLFHRTNIYTNPATHSHTNAHIYTRAASAGHRIPSKAGRALARRPQSRPGRRGLTSEHRERWGGKWPRKYSENLATEERRRFRVAFEFTRKLFFLNFWFFFDNLFLVIFFDFWYFNTRRRLLHSSLTLSIARHSSTDKKATRTT